MNNNYIHVIRQLPMNVSLTVSDDLRKNPSRLWIFDSEEIEVFELEKLIIVRGGEEFTVCVGQG